VKGEKYVEKGFEKTVRNVKAVYCENVHLEEMA
jgi:hypothetical protein